MTKRAVPTEMERLPTNALRPESRHRNNALLRRHQCPGVSPGIHAPADAETAPLDVSLYELLDAPRSAWTAA